MGSVRNNRPLSVYRTQKTPCVNNGPFFRTEPGLRTFALLHSDTTDTMWQANPAKIPADAVCLVGAPRDTWYRRNRLLLVLGRGTRSGPKRLPGTDGPHGHSEHGVLQAGIRIYKRNTMRFCSCVAPRGTSVSLSIEKGVHVSQVLPRCMGVETNLHGRRRGVVDDAVRPN